MLLARRAWKSTSLDEFDRDAQRLDQACSGPQEGHSGQLDVERRIYVTLARLPEVKTICEIGFNKGNSAMLWLRANPKARVVMFDLWKYSVSECGLKTILADATLEA